MSTTSDRSVEVLLFSVLRERVGAASIRIALAEPVTARALVERIATDHPPVRPAIATLRVAVNQVYVGDEHLVEAGDEVALITPVSGG